MLAVFTCSLSADAPCLWQIKFVIRSFIEISLNYHYANPSMGSKTVTAGTSYNKARPNQDPCFF